MCSYQTVMMQTVSSGTLKYKESQGITTLILKRVPIIYILPTTTRQKRRRKLIFNTLYIKVQMAISEQHRGFKTALFVLHQLCWSFLVLICSSSREQWKANVWQAVMQNNPHLQTFLGLSHLSTLSVTVGFFFLLLVFSHSEVFSIAFIILYQVEDELLGRKKKVYFFILFIFIFLKSS